MGEEKAAGWLRSWTPLSVPSALRKAVMAGQRREGRLRIIRGGGDEDEARRAHDPAGGERVLPWTAAGGLGFHTVWGTHTNPHPSSPGLIEFQTNFLLLVGMQLADPFESPCFWF